MGSRPRGNIGRPDIPPSPFLVPIASTAGAGEVPFCEGLPSRHRTLRPGAATRCGDTRPARGIGAGARRRVATATNLWYTDNIDACVPVSFRDETPFQAPRVGSLLH